MRPNISLGDTLAGLHAAFGAVMALLHRQRWAGGGEPCDFHLLVGAVGYNKGVQKGTTLLSHLSVLSL